MYITRQFCVIWWKYLCYVIKLKCDYHFNCINSSHIVNFSTDYLAGTSWTGFIARIKLTLILLSKYLLILISLIHQIFRKRFRCHWGKTVRMESYFVSYLSCNIECFYSYNIIALKRSLAPPIFFFCSISEVTKNWLFQYMVIPSSDSPSKCTHPLEYVLPKTSNSSEMPGD